MFVASLRFRVVCTSQWALPNATSSSSSSSKITYRHSRRSRPTPDSHPFFSACDGGSVFPERPAATFADTLETAASLRSATSFSAPVGPTFGSRRTAPLYCYVFVFQNTVENANKMMKRALNRLNAQIVWRMFSGTSSHFKKSHQAFSSVCGLCGAFLSLQSGAGGRVYPS